MPISKFFSIPFAVSGDRTTIPEATQPSGAISYQQGYGPDYERNPASDPLAKRVPRDETNELYYQITGAIGAMQLYGAPEWYAVDSSGNPVSYPINAVVRWGDTIYRSLVTTNTVEPGTDLTKWSTVRNERSVLWRGMVSFTSSGSFNPASYGLTAEDRILCMVWGAGGGGASFTGGYGGSGGAGGFAMGIYPAPTSPLTVTVGTGGSGSNTGGTGATGGTTSIGTLLQATGGFGAGGGPGAGGVGSGGMINLSGGAGCDLMSLEQDWAIGGSAPFFGGGLLSNSALNPVGSGGAAILSANRVEMGGPGLAWIIY